MGVPGEQGLRGRYVPHYCIFEGCSEEVVHLDSAQRVQGTEEFSGDI